MKLITEDDFDEECTDGTIELKILVDKKQKAEILKDQLIAHRLKKQIEELAEGSYLKTELQKIMEGKPEIICINCQNGDHEQCLLDECDCS